MRWRHLRLLLADTECIDGNWLVLTLVRFSTILVWIGYDLPSMVASIKLQIDNEILLGYVD